MSITMSIMQFRKVGIASIVATGIGLAGAQLVMPEMVDRVFVVGSSVVCGLCVRGHECSLHHAKMHIEIKTLHYGLTWGMPVKPTETFPNSHKTEWAATCLVGHKGYYRWFWVCPVCRENEEKWEKQHPDWFWNH